MSKKGTLIYWTVSDILATPDQIKALGFKPPRNDFKSAMIKALRVYTKGNDKHHRTFNDVADSVSFGVFVQTVNGGSIDMNREVQLHVDKKTGTARFDEGFDSHLIRGEFETAKTTLNADQLRSSITSYVRENHGISMRPSGGIYYIDNKVEATLVKLREFFAAFPAATKLFEVPIYDDSGSLEAIEEATSSSLFNDIENLIKDFTESYNKGTLTKKQLENRREDAAKILKEVKLHEQNLRSKAESLSAKVDQVQKVLEKQMAVISGSLVDTEEFTTMLRDL